jgi:hypothetical protein
VQEQSEQGPGDHGEHDEPCEAGFHAVLLAQSL